MALMDFHIHSNYSTDGIAQIAEIVDEAIKSKVKVVGIVDHIRGSADWIGERENDINRVLRRIGDKIEIFTGLEAKIVDDAGRINLDPNLFKEVDFVVGSFHGVPSNILKETERNIPKALADWWATALVRVLERKEVDVIGHPDRRIDDQPVFVSDRHRLQILEAVSSCSIFLEWNPIHDFPDQKLVRALSTDAPKSIVFASDSHSVQDMRVAYRNISDFEKELTREGNMLFAQILRGKRLKSKRPP